VAGAGKLRQPAQQLKVLVRGLGEAQPRIPEDLIGPHAGGRQPVGRRLQLGPHLRHHIAIHRQGIHRAAVAPAVHHHIGATGPGHHACHGGIAQTAAAAHVVDPVSTGRQGRLRHRGVKGVNRQHGSGMGGTDRREHRQQPLQLLRRSHLLRSGPGALGPQIKQISPLGQQPPGLRQRLVDAADAAAVTEGIGGEVHHPHHQRAVRRDEGQTAAGT